MLERHAPRSLRVAVSRCICSNVTFAELLDMARTTGCDIEELQSRTGCGEGCGTCLPYILRTLETGVTNHPILSEDECVCILSRYPSLRQSLA